MAQVLAQSNEQAAAGRRNEGEVGERRLDRFLRNNLPTFKGRFDPEGAQTWVQGMERIFRAMVTTSLVCAKCPVNFGNVDFKLDLVCLPLKHREVIFGMDLMLSFGVSINCLTKSIPFSKLVAEVGVKFLTAEQVKKSLDGEACVLMIQ